MGSCLSELCGSEEEDYQPLHRNKEPQFEHVQDVRGAPTDKDWYHGGITDQEADRRLRSVTIGGDKLANWSKYDGTYLVYDNPGRRDEYILLVFYRGDLCKWKISRRSSDGQYILGDDGPDVIGHETVRKLIKYHRGATGKPIKLQHGGTVTLSKSYAYQPKR